MTKITLGILASGSGSNFAAIAQAFAANSQIQIGVLIYNNPTAQVAQRAAALNIPALLLDHREFTNRAALDQAIADVLATYKVDLVVMAGWMRIVTQVLIDAYPDRILNIHPSLLPSFPGIHAVEQALSYGVKITGCTVHLVSLAVDSGPILAQAAVEITPEDTVSSLQAKIQVQEHRIYPAAIAAHAQTLL
ncbi:MAG: phosphoribosylglycinamide formyltransferase [Pseudanabaenaceae cyanobacterium bins.68]|nr:phosphoribosylglycinamide formyltransferase [Pseudanabaenaceae cyanobacterium bins.68]